MKNSIIYTCLTEGDFTLHSGQKTRYLFDIVNYSVLKHRSLSMMETIKCCTRGL